MTDEEIQITIESIKKASIEACKSRESTIKFLLDAGIIGQREKLTPIQRALKEIEEQVGKELERLPSEHNSIILRKAVDLIESANGSYTEKEYKIRVVRAAAILTRLISELNDQP